MELSCRWCKGLQRLSTRHATTRSFTRASVSIPSTHAVIHSVSKAVASAQKVVASAVTKATTGEPRKLEPKPHCLKPHHSLANPLQQKALLAKAKLSQTCQHKAR